MNEYRPGTPEYAQLLRDAHEVLTQLSTVICGQLNPAVEATRLLAGQEPIMARTWDVVEVHKGLAEMVAWCRWTPYKARGGELGLGHGFDNEVQRCLARIAEGRHLLTDLLGDAGTNPADEAAEVLARCASASAPHGADPAWFWLKWDHPLIDQLITDAKCVLGELTAALPAVTVTAKAAAALAGEDLRGECRGLVTHISEVSTELEQLLQEVDECRHQRASPFKRVVNTCDLRVALSDAAVHLRMLRGEGP